MHNLERTANWLQQEIEKTIEKFYLDPSDANKRILLELQKRLQFLKREVSDLVLDV